MKLVGLFLLTLCILASSEGSETKKQHKSLKETPKTSSSDDIEKTTTPKPTTTTTTEPTPEPTTAKPTTPEPTTPEPTTAKPTTPEPTTPEPTTVKPTPEPKPTPSPAPKDYYWEVVAKNGTICILAKMEITLDMKYKSNNKSQEATIKVPSNATSSGMCDDKQQTLVLDWVTNDGLNSLTVNFTSDNKTNEYYISSLDASISKDGEVFNVSAPLKPGSFMGETPLNSSYTCEYSSNVDLKQDSTTVKASFNKIHLEAFRSDTSDKFSKTYACGTDTPDIVPIVVGVALTLLIIGVVVGYIISRRRSAQRGYLSM